MKTACISGMGMVSPLGDTVQHSWERISKGESGISRITLFETSSLRNQEGGEAHSALVEDIPRGLQMLSAAVSEAIQESGLTDLSDCALVIGTNFGSTTRYSDYYASRSGGTPDRNALSDYRFQSYADHLKETFSIGGPSAIISIACATGIGILDTGLMMLKHCPRVICASADELTLYSYAGLNALRAITKDRIRPFSKTRSGTQFGEGAGAVILEQKEALSARQGTCAAVLEACALNNDAFHTTAPDKEGTGIAAVMKEALSAADISAEDITYFCAHGTGTKYNDSIETKALKKVFGTHAEKLKINALKSMTAHAMGAAGIIEFICTVMSIKTGIIPPTIGFEEHDEECSLDYCLDGPVEADITAAMSNSYGIGGANGSAIISGEKNE